MLKELVRERLIAAADEIFGLVEKTIASYEEQLRRAREESEQHRRQLEQVCNVVRVKDVKQQWGVSSSDPGHPPPPNLDREENKPHLPHIKKEDMEFPLTGVSGEDEDKPLRWMQLHPHSPRRDHSGGAPPEKLLVPQFDSGNVEPVRSTADQEGDENQSKYSETTFGNKETSQPVPCFTCPFCSKRFSANSILTIHLRTHTGEKPFACPICGKRFAQKPSLATHMKTHTGEKPFSCSICHKTFSRRYHLEIHMRTHTGEKPYSCAVCGVKFRHRSSLKVHMRVHNTE